MEPVQVIFDLSAFSIDAVKNAAYRMAKTLDTEIRIAGDQIICNVRPRAGGPVEGLVKEFRREVIDHDLRLEIRKQTQDVRNLILAHAFSRTGIVPSE